MQKLTRYSLAAALSITGLFPAGRAVAADAKDAIEFHELLRSALPAELATEKKMPLVHMLPNDNILRASEADTIGGALEEVKKTSLVELLQNTVSAEANSKAEALDADRILARKPLTIVIAPGFLGEFIENRGFEEAFAPIDSKLADAARNSNSERGGSTQVRDERTADFLDKLAAAKAAGDKNAVDERTNTYTLKTVHEVDLSDVVHVGAIKAKDGRILAKVVIFYTQKLSLESIGDLKNHAEIFNRRLAKYLALTGPQNLAFLGYSRGTPLALEMLAQAKEQNLPWLASVKAMISLGGVSWGSSLADVFDKPGDSKIALDLVKGLSRDLIAPDTSIINPFFWKDVATNGATWAGFGVSTLCCTAGKSHHAELPAKKYQGQGALDGSIDAGSVLGLASSVFVGLGLTEPVKGYANNIRRFQMFVDAMVEGIVGLTSNARLEWWKTHTVPATVRYYSITAAMANPGNSETEEKLFNTAIGYSVNADDRGLLQNSLDYKSESGVALNDSQVAIAQAMILPKAVAKLNPANAGLQETFLGTCGTHHWGLALRKVAVKSEVANPFPREALLKALAAKVALDMKN